MKKQEIEFKVLDIIDRLEHGQPIEDNEVELKARWPEDHFRAARRIAAHANSAGGANIMWLIGVDEKKGVIGARFEELSTWYAKVTSKFDQLIAPTLISLSVPYKGKTVAALVFETDRAPYVIRIPNSHTGPVTHEVPWREANSTRSARRSDLIKMLYTVNRKPEIEVLNGIIELQKAITSERSGQCRFQWALSMQVYFAAHTTETIVFPFHKCNIVFRQRGNADEKSFENIKINPPSSFSSREFKEKPQSLTVNATDYEVLIKTAGMAYITGEFYSESNNEMFLPEHLDVKAYLKTHISDDPIIFETAFKLEKKSENVSDRLMGEWRAIIKK